MAIEKGTLKILNRRKQLLTWDQIRRRQRSLDWHYLVCKDTKALVGQGSFCTAGLTKVLHCRELASPTSCRKKISQKDDLRVFLFQSWTFIHVFVLLALHTKVFFVGPVPLFNLQALACSFLSNKFPCFPLNLIFSFPKLC